MGSSHLVQHGLTEVAGFEHMAVRRQLGGPRERVAPIHVRDLGDQLLADREAVRASGDELRYMPELTAHWRAR